MKLSMPALMFALAAAAPVAGQLKVKRGQVGYVADNKSLPTHVKISPFDDPAITAAYDVDAEFDTEVHPPRIEQEVPASPS